MVTIGIKDDYFDLKCTLQEDGPTAHDVLRAFTGLMLTQTYSVKTIRNALDEVLYDFNEQLKLQDETNNNE